MLFEVGLFVLEREMGDHAVTTEARENEVSLTDRVRRVEDAWFSGPGQFSDGFIAEVFDDSVIVERRDGLFRFPYQFGDDGAIAFGEPVKVEQQFVEVDQDSPPAAETQPNTARRQSQALSSPANCQRTRAGVAAGLLHAAARLLRGSAGAGVDGRAGFDASFPAPPVSRSAAPASASVGSGVPGGNGMFLQVPFRVYSDDEERYVGGPVLVPGNENAYGDLWAAEDIRILAHRFMEKYRHMDVQHTSVTGSVPIESVYLPTEEEGGQKSYKFYGEDLDGGTWWLGTRVTDDDAWQAVKDGKLKGFSIFAVQTQAQANKRYGLAVTDAPPGKVMKASDWDVTMVSLVDEPAVFKATYVAIRRAPDGSVVEYDATGMGPDTMQALEREVGVIHRILDAPGVETGRRLKLDGGTDMKMFRRMAATDGVEETVLTKPHAQPVVPPEPQGDSGNQNPAPQAQASGAGVNAPDADEHADLLQAVRNEVRESIAASLKPLEERVNGIEAKVRSMSGHGALPDGGDDDSDDPDGHGRQSRSGGLPRWANVGGRRNGTREKAGSRR